MANDKAMSMEEARAKDKKARKQDWIICCLGCALALLAKVVA